MASREQLERDMLELWERDLARAHEDVATTALCLNTS
jgi:hypothetical protein